MDHKSSGEQVEPEKEQWLLIGTTVAGLVGLLAPVACLAIFLGHSGVFWDFLLNVDYSKFRALSYSARSRQRLLVWIRNNVLMPLSYGANLTEADLWRDGSILCSLVNLLVPEACTRPQNHYGERPSHGQTLALKYLGIAPIFTDEEFAQETLTPQQQKKFFKYLSAIHQSISQITNKTFNMKFSTDYVSRGMGLVVAEQNQKSVFYIYPIPRHFHLLYPCDIEVSIKGPYGCQGYIVIPSILHHKQRCQKPTDYTRSLYMTSKLNSISPTTQGTSFFRKLTLRERTKRVDPSQEIVIKVKLTQTRAKVSYVPQRTGIYEVSLVTNGCHVVGSPYTVPVQLARTKTYLSNDSDTESDEENQTRFVRQKKRIISRIVDFVDEKMILQPDGSLVKISEIEPRKNVNELEACKNMNESEECKDMNEIEPCTNINELETLKKIHKLEPCKNINALLKNKEDLITEMSTQNSEQLIEDTFLNKVAETETNPNEETSNETKEDDVRLNESILEDIIDETKNTPADGTKIQNDNDHEHINVILDEENDDEDNFLIICNAEPDIKMAIDNKKSPEIENMNVQGQGLSKDTDEIEDNQRTTDSIIHDSMFESYFHVEMHKIRETQAKEENALNIEITDKVPREIDEKEYSFDSDSDTTEDNYIFHVINNSLVDSIDINCNTSSLKNNNVQQRTAPDILEPSNNNSTRKLSESSTEFVDDLQTLAGKSFDPTSDLAEVQDQNFHRTSFANGIKKTFSTKDPSKEESSLDNYVNLQRNHSVNNLIKVFDGSSNSEGTACSANVPRRSRNNGGVLTRWREVKDSQTIDGPLRNEPDLVQCHGKPFEKLTSPESLSDASKSNEPTDEKLTSMGVVLTDFDKRQRYLKSVLTYHLNNMAKRKLSAPHRKYRNEPVHTERTSCSNISPRSDLVIGGVVERQKKFWQEKFNTANSDTIVMKHSLKFSIRSSAKPVTKRTEIINSKKNCEAKHTPVQSRSFDGLVRNTTQIFETKSMSSESINKPAIRGNALVIQKCKSEGNIQYNSSRSTLRSAQIQKAEAAYHYPSIEQRKAQLLKAYSETTLSRCDSKSCIQQSRSVDQALHQSCNVPPEQETVSPQTVDKQIDDSQQTATSGAQKLVKKSSVRRRARFKRAKLFFHHLERSQWKSKLDLATGIDAGNQLQFQRSESAPCLDRQLEEEEDDEVQENALPAKLSDRFQVNDLFRDILGDSDKRFLGIPNKMAVVASLASLDSDSSKTEFDSTNEDEQQQQQSKQAKKQRFPGPGFHAEYPHPPMTERWMYKSRSNTDLAGLIPRRVLLRAATNHSLDI